MSLVSPTNKGEKPLPLQSFGELESAASIAFAGLFLFSRTTCSLYPGGDTATE